jgi:thymidylate synthase
MVYFNLIYAIGVNGEFGNKSGLPWGKLKCDLQRFKSVTTKSKTADKEPVLIMGRNTFDSLPCLSGRKLVVVTHSEIDEKNENLLGTSVDLESALEKAFEYTKGKTDIFVIGGSRLVEQALEHPGLEYIFKTTIQPLHDSLPADVHMYKQVPERFRRVRFENLSSNGIFVSFDDYKVIRRSFENQYLDLLRELVLQSKEGVRDDRTGTGTFSLFAPAQLDIDLRKGFPLVTTKRVFFRGVVEELLFFLKGKTQTKELEEKGVHIWKGNTTREFLDKRGLNHLEEGDYGKLYGHQWRRFGQTDTFEGVDQIKEVIRQLKEEPMSRRILLTAWNPAELDQMSLAPCHTFSQYYVNKNNGLECHLYLRSSDAFLGLPFNIASYALLTCLLAHYTGKKADRLVVSFGDAHLYQNHIEQAREQLERTVRRLPLVELVDMSENWEDVVVENVVLKGYEPHPSISGVMAV